MTRQISRAIFLATLTVLLLGLALTMAVLYGNFSALQREQLAAQTRLVARGVANEGLPYTENLPLGEYRLTWIAADGAVLADSRADAVGMENHLDREEVKEAFATGFGESVRESATLTQRQLYCAQRLADGSVLRLSCAGDTVWAMALRLLPGLILITVLALISSVFLAARLSRRIVEPLNRLNLDDPLANTGYDELSPLLRRIEGQQEQIRDQQTALSARRAEFEAVTGQMNEGLVLLSRQGKILSINRAAARLLGADKDAAGQDMLLINRTPALQELLSAAQKGQRGQILLPLAAGQYELIASPVDEDGRIPGVVLLLLDVTERESAEERRREFTANVSHELKTPLHSISGCAELLRQGLVKPEDQAAFTDQIYREAQRMITLVDDILRLSRLDEGDGLAREKTDLFALARAVTDRMSPAARDAGVTLTLTGQAAPMTGIPALLTGILTNLCDNGIKYNHPGGQVRVNVKNEPACVCLTVEDTGIGIPPEHQGRIFERFYRVDKSRSKAVGGTGLGLAIVKHSARLHRATVELSSTPGEGSVFSLRFPKEDA